MVAAAILPALAGPIQLVKDINQTVSLPSAPAKPIQLGDRWVLTICTTSAGCQPWITDGTPAGTRLIKDLGIQHGPGPYVVMGGHAYFLAATSQGEHLYRTDGTAQGTSIVTTVRTAGGLAATASTLYFAGPNDRLWKSDGTPAGSVQIGDVAAPRELAAAGGKAFFRKGEYASTQWIWASDGTPANTIELVEVAPYAGEDNVGMVAVGPRMYFWGATATPGVQEAFVSDGTVAGTVPLGNINRTPSSGFAELGGEALVFGGGRAPTYGTAVYRSDGTPGGTTLVSSLPDSFIGLPVRGGPLVYINHPFELWRTDGTAAGTLKVSSGFAANLVGTDEALYYSGGGYGPIMRSEGTAATTTVLLPLHAPAPSLSLGNLLLLRDSFALDSIAWVSDGTTEGTVALAVAAGEPTNGSLCSTGEAQLGDQIFFAADDGVHGCELWVTDGTPGGTRMVKDLAPGRQSGFPNGHYNLLTATGSYVFFRGQVAEFNANARLWRSDGSDAGTIPLTPASSLHDRPESLAALGSQVYFHYYIGATNQLWRSDGTPAGTVPVVSTDHPPNYPSSMTAVGETLFYLANSGTLWKVEGGAASQVYDSTPYGLRRLTAAGSQLFFVRNAPDIGTELWRSDGTTAGTGPVIDLRPGSDSSMDDDALLMAPMGNGLIFSARDSGFFPNVWRTDGTAAGTTLLAAGFAIGVSAEAPGRLFYFVRGPGVDGRTLWRTDGTPGGTWQIAYVSEQFVRAAKVAKGTLFFQASNFVAGDELHRSDGTAAGTFMIEDFVPGPTGIATFRNMVLHELSGGLLFRGEAKAAGDEPHFYAFDTEPDALVFTTKPGTPTDVDIISDPAQVTGINVAASVTASGGQFCVSSGANCGCDIAPFAAAGHVHGGQYICVKHRSALTFGTQTTTTLDVGGIAATFTSQTIVMHPLEVVVAGSGSVVSSIPGIACPDDCAASYAEGTNVVLYASAAPGASFAGWSGACTGTGACMLAMTASRSATATFTAAPLIIPRRDFSGDGRSDLLWRHTNGTYGVWTMNGLSASGFGGVSAGAGALIKQIGDFDGNGRYDVLWRRADGSYQVDLMNGVAVVGTATILGAGTGWEVVHTGDFDGDGKTDLVWKGPTGTIGIWLMNGLAFTTAGTAAHPGVGYDVVKVADFDGDDKADLLWRHSDGRIQITTMNGLSSTGSAQLLGVANGWTPVHVGDLDGDGKADIAWMHANGSIGLWLMDGLAIKQYATVMGSGSGWTISHLADLDGDGRVDLMWSHTSGTRAAWMMNGVSATSYGVFFGAGSGWSAAATGDYDGDGKDDIVWKHTDGTHRLWLMHGLAVKGSSTLVGASGGWSVQP